MSRDGFFEEGINGFVPYDGSIYDYLPVSKKQLEATITAVGASNLDEFHTLATLEPQSPQAQTDGRVHDMIGSDDPGPCLAEETAISAVVTKWGNGRTEGRRFQDQTTSA